MKQPTTKDIWQAVNGQLSGYPWGGEVVAVRQNQWGEWIADCHVWGQYGLNPEDPDWVYYRQGDEKCPIRQFMVRICRIYSDGSISVTLYEAKNNKRLPTFCEECGIIDRCAPPSPYIVEPIKKYLEVHKKDPLPF